MEKPRKQTHVAVGSRIAGQISGSTELLVDGEVEGEIHLSSTVVIGQKGAMLGNIAARSVQVAGKVIGNVSGEERVELLPSGTVEGDVTSPRVVIAEGAFFRGKVRMRKAEERRERGGSDESGGQSGKQTG